MYDFVKKHIKQSPFDNKNTKKTKIIRHELEKK